MLIVHRIVKPSAHTSLVFHSVIHASYECYRILIFMKLTVISNKKQKWVVCCLEGMLTQSNYKFYVLLELTLSSAGAY